MGTIDEVIDRVRKLLALAGSANEHEAALAAKRAAELMAQHNLERAQLETETGQRAASPIDDVTVDASRSVVYWKGELAAAVATAHGCHMYYRGGGVALFGRRDDISAATYVYRYLCNEVARLADEGWARDGQPYEPVRSWKHAFRLGCAGRVAARIRESLAPKPGAVVTPPPAASGAALVLRRDAAEVDAAFAVRAKRFTRNVQGPTLSSGGGYAAGTAAGNTVRLAGGGARLGAAPGKLTGQR